MIAVQCKGSYKKADRYFKKKLGLKIEDILRNYGEKGVNALSKATPVDTGKTASSWYYAIESDSKSMKIVWNNSNTNHGVNIAIILQYGHATGWGGYVTGIDYINPALQPVFDQFTEELVKEVKRDV